VKINIYQAFILLSISSCDNKSLSQENHIKDSTSMSSYSAIYVDHSENFPHEDLTKMPSILFISDERILVYLDGDLVKSASGKLVIQSSTKVVDQIDAKIETTVIVARLHTMDSDEMVIRIEKKLNNITYKTERGGPFYGTLAGEYFKNVDLE
jgi:hypothetical protein